jgi:hypothetical protein
MTWNGKLIKDDEGIRVVDAGSLDNMPAGEYTFGGHESFGTLATEEQVSFGNGRVFAYARTVTPNAPNHESVAEEL